MTQSAQRNRSELVMLVIDLVEVILSATRNLRYAADALRHNGGSAAARNPSDVIAELQKTFQTLVHCAFVTRETTDRLRAVIQAGRVACRSISRPTGPEHR